MHFSFIDILEMTNSVLIEGDSGQGADAPRVADRTYFYIFGLAEDFRSIMQIFCDKYSTADLKITDMFSKLILKRSNRPVPNTVLRRGATQITVQYYSGHAFITGYH